jgi:hypothetical protein
MATEIDAKGDLIVGTGADAFARLAVGTNGHTLVADSVEATGLKWVAPAAGGMTLINTGGTTLTGASTTVSSIPSGYRNLHIVIVNFDPATDNDRLTFQINGDGGANRYRTLDFNNPANTNTTFNGDRFYIGQTADDGTNTGITWIDIYEYDNTSIWKMIGYASVNNDWTTPTNLSDQWGQGYYNQTNAITSLKFACQTGNLNAGTVYVYGVK